ncbi:MAG: holo-ACP synthase [Clostridiaceae bacterium]
MIAGIGVDIIEIIRIENAIKKNERFMEKMFNPQEQAYLASRNARPEYIAGRFAAKEAVAKALGTGFVGFGYRDIEIVRAESGKPEVILKDKADEIASRLGDYRIQLSISHSRGSAIAFAILEV